MYQLNPASIEDSEIYNQSNNNNKKNNIYKKPVSNRTLKNKNVSFLTEDNDSSNSNNGNNSNNCNNSNNSNKCRSKKK